MSPPGRTPTRPSANIRHYPPPRVRHIHPKLSKHNRQRAKLRQISTNRITPINPPIEGSRENVETMGCGVLQKR